MVNLLAKWGRKILITGIVSLAFDLILSFYGIDFLSGLGDSYINVILIILGAIGIYIDRNLLDNVKVDDKKFALQMTQALLEEKKDKKILEWDKNSVLEYLKQTLSSDKFSMWIKTNEINISENFILDLKIYFTSKDNLIEPFQEIRLKNGKKYQQNKHELVIKKEYSEKIFLCSINLIKEIFEKLIKLQELNIMINLTDPNIGILKLKASREQFLILKNSKLENVTEELKLFDFTCNFDPKNFDFKEI